MKLVISNERSKGVFLFMLLFPCLFKITMIDRSMFRSGSGLAGTGSSMILQLTQKLEAFTNFGK